MRSVHVVLTALAIALPACGGALAPEAGDGGGGGGDAGSSPVDSASPFGKDTGGLSPDAESCVQRELMANQACATCLESSCGAAFTSTLSACAALLSCECACGTGNATCEESCSSMVSPTCTAAAAPLSTCEQANCQSPCMTMTVSPPPDAAVPPGLTGTCATLAACCGMLPTNEQMECVHIATLDNQSACSAGLSAFTQAGQCN